ncbi:MAG: MFS transporter [Peptococcaceae bacterium]|nr:MFS transporter [Peptococcaceae bacterium]
MGQNPEQASTGRRDERPALAALCFGTMAVISDIYVVQPILPLLSEGFGVSPAVASLAVSFNILALSFALLIYGPVSDFVGRKPVMVATSLLLALPTAALALTTSFPAFLALRAVQGLFVAGIAAIAMAYIAEEFPPAAVGRVMGIYVSAMVASGLFGRVCGGILAGLFSWRVTFATFSLLNLLGAWLMLRFLPASRNFKRNAGLFASYSGMFGHFKNRRLVGAFLIGFTLFFTFTGTFTYVTFYLSAPPFSLSTVALSFIFLAYVTGIISPAAGTVSGRTGRRPVIGFGLAVATLGILLTLVQSLPAIITGLVLLCTGLFSTQPAASAMVGDNAAVGKGSATALYLFFYYIGGSIGAVLPGFLWTAQGWPGVIASCCAAIAAAFLSLFALCR